MKKKNQRVYTGPKHALRVGPGWSGKHCVARERVKKLVEKSIFFYTMIFGYCIDLVRNIRSPNQHLDPFHTINNANCCKHTEGQNVGATKWGDMLFKRPDLFSAL